MRLVFPLDVGAAGCGRGRHPTMVIRDPALSDAAPEGRRSALGPADPVDVALAAEELRGRTMRLEEARTFPSAWLIVSTLGAVIAIVALLLVFRADLRLLLRGMGL